MIKVEMWFSVYHLIIDEEDCDINFSFVGDFVWINVWMWWENNDNDLWCILFVFCIHFDTYIIIIIYICIFY